MEPIRAYTVVVADDHEDMAETIAEALEWYEGVKVLGIAHDGLEALALAVEHLPDVLVTDFEMPGMTGLEVTLALIRIAPAVRVILMTGRTDEWFPQHLVRAVLFKPINIDDLMRAIVNAVEK